MGFCCMGCINVLGLPPMSTDRSTVGKYVSLLLRRYHYVGFCAKPQALQTPFLNILNAIWLFLFHTCTEWLKPRIFINMYLIATNSHQIVFTALLKDLPNPEQQLAAAPISAQDMALVSRKSVLCWVFKTTLSFQIKSAIGKAQAAIDDIKVDNQEDIVVPFRIP